MSTVKQFVFPERIYGPYGPDNGLVIPAYKWSGSAYEYQPTATQSGAGKDWNIPINPGVYVDIDLANFKFFNPTYDGSKTIKVIWEQGDTGYPGPSADGTAPTIAEFRIPHPTFNIPASKCRIRFEEATINSGGVTTINGSEMFIRYTASWTVIDQNDNFITTGPVVVSDRIPSYLETSSALLNHPTEISVIPMGKVGIGPQTQTLIQQGSVVTGGLRNDIENLEYYLKVERISGSVNFKTVVLGPQIRSDNAIREYEANKYIIDGQDNDIVVFQPVVSSIVAQATIILFASSTLNSEFTLTENSVNKKYAVVQPISTSAILTVDAHLKFNPTKTLTANTDLLASTANLKLAEADLTAATAVSLVTAFKPSTGVLLINPTTTASFLGNMIYDVTGNYNWDSFNLNSYFQQGFIAPEYAADQGEYTWEFLSTDTWDDWATITWVGNESSWDNWPDNIWERIFTLPIISTVAVQPLFKLGDVLTYTGAFTFAEQSAFEKASAFDVDSAFITSFTASGVIDAEADISSAFAPGLTANIAYESVEITITGAFSPVLIANVAYDSVEWAVDTAFALAVAPTFKPSAYQTELYVDVNTVLLGNEIYDSPLALSALASTLSVIRLFYAADPYNIWTIDPETRVIVVLEENRRASVLQENRLNTIEAEMRNYLVPQETRNLKLRVAPFKNRFSIPKVRAEQ